MGIDLRHPHFAEPAWLWLALLAPLCLVALHRYAAAARSRQLSRVAAPEMLGKLLVSHSPARRAFKNALLVAAFGAMGLALARPQWGQTVEVSQSFGEDIMFLLDCSKSMLSTDVQPNRLNRAKYAILDFVQKHGRGRVGLVAFAGQAFLQCPLTFDYDAFREALLNCDERSIPVPGTDIGRALDEASLAMEKNERRKVLVLLTDGEDLQQTGIKTAQALAKKGIVVYTVGVGTVAGTPIHVMNDQGGSEVLRDMQGNVVISHLDAGTLTQIAQATHGAYQPLGSLGEGLEQIRRNVEDSTDVQQASRVRKLGVDRFHWVIGAVIFLLVAESLVGTRRRVRQAAR
jgi:Ca-activated chloride channel family protein